MNGLGFHMLLSLIGVRSFFVHREVMDILEMIHVLGNAYRLASSGTSWGAVYGRFTLGFCWSIVARVQSRISAL